jgi:outer membrane protein assembly factor BamB
MRTVLRSLCLALVFGLPCLGTTAGAPEPNPGPAPQRESLVQTAGVQGGFCLVLAGSTDAVALALELGRSPGCLVQLLAEEAGIVVEARQRIAAAQCGERVFADAVASFRDLPYVDNLANLVVVAGRAGTPESLREAERVLAPRGVRLHGPGPWQRLVKAVPAGQAEWTHNRYDASGSAVSADTVGMATELRWLAGRYWSGGTILAVASAGGRMFYCVAPDRQKSGSLTLVARDAFNGLPLWNRSWEGEIQTPELFPYQELPDEKPEWAGKVARFSAGVSVSRPGCNALPFTAGKDCLFTIFEDRAVALDAVTGATLRTFEASGAPRDLVLAGNTLLLGAPGEIRAFEATSAKLLWKAPLSSKDIVVEGGSLFCLDVGKNPAEPVSLDLATGAERWRNAAPPWAKDLAQVKPPLSVLYLRFCQAGTIIVTGGRGLYALAAADGKALWSKETNLRVSKFRYAAYSDAWPWGGDIWTYNYDEDNREGRFAWVLNPATGEVKKKVPGGMPHCTRTVATGQMMISGHYVSFLSDQKSFQVPMIRNACNLGVLPANGMLYGMPHGCICKPWYLPGYQGFGMPGQEPAATPRLEKGPAFGRTRPVSTADGNDWPIYRHDARRSAGTAETLPDKLELLWAAPFPGQADADPEYQDDPAWNGPLSPPTASEDSVFVSLPNRRQVVALEARSGKEKWRFTAGGRVRLPPTLHRGLCLIAAQDGQVYAVEAADGRLAWRLRARDSRRELMAYGQPESLWPVLNVVVCADTAYFASGRSANGQEGTVLTAVKALTGELLFEKTLKEYEALQDIPALDQDGSFLHFPNMPGWELNLATREEKSLAAVPSERIKGRLTLASKPDKLKGPARLVLSNGTAWKGAVPGEANWRHGSSKGDLLSFTTDFTAAYSLKSKAGQVQVAGAKPAPLQTMATPCALVIAGNQVLLAGADSSGKTGRLLISSTTGVLRQEIHFAAAPVYDGLAVAQGRLFVSLQDGQLLCFGKK